MARDPSFQHGAPNQGAPFCFGAPFRRAPAARARNSLWINHLRRDDPLGIVVAFVLPEPRAGNGAALAKLSKGRNP